jgi:hypothetical protein
MAQCSRAARERSQELAAIQNIKANVGACEKSDLRGKNAPLEGRLAIGYLAMGHVGKVDRYRRSLIT